jgi:hypothetical protein
MLAVWRPNLLDKHLLVARQHQDDIAPRIDGYEPGLIPLTSQPDLQALPQSHRSSRTATA